MNSKLKEAVRKVSALDDARQEELASIILGMAEERTEWQPPDKALKPMIDEALSQVERGEVHSGDELFWERHRARLRARQSDGK